MTPDRYYFFSLAVRVPTYRATCPSIHGILEAAVDRTRYTASHTGHFRQQVHTRAVLSRRYYANSSTRGKRHEEEFAVDGVVATRATCELREPARW